MADYYYPELFDPHHNHLNDECPAFIEDVCTKIREACEGLGTDEKAIIEVLSPLKASDRELVAHHFERIYGDELCHVIKSETSGDFGFLLRLLCLPLPEMESYVLHQACVGMGTTESLLYPILIGRKPKELELLKRTYFDKYNEDLAVLMDSELSGDFRKVIVASIQGQMEEYDASYHTTEFAEEQAEKLYKAGQGKWGTDEETFIKIMVTSPPQFLRLVNEWYAKKYNNTIHRAIEKEFGGDARRALIFHYGLVVDPFDTLAELLESTMKGLGTDEKGLSTAIVRCAPWLSAVSSAYERKYETSLRDRVKGETSGDYRRLLLALLDASTTDAPASP